MTWNAAVFTVVNEARRLAPRHHGDGGGVQLNGMVHELINAGFFETQMTAIRRLADCGPFDGNKASYSLAALIDDMRNCSQVITREALLAAEGLEYDHSEIKKRHDEYCLSQSRQGINSFWLPPALDYARILTRHKEIDALSGKTKKSRQRNDMVGEKIWGKLSDTVTSACKDIKVYATKYIAHAATPESRAAANVDKVKVSLAHIKQAHRALCDVANFISIYLLSGSQQHFLPTPQYDQFLYITSPLVSTKTLPAVRDAWKHFERSLDDSAGWRKLLGAEMPEQE